MMPRDTNHYGTIFGGVILAYIDQAGFVEALRYGSHKWVTVSMDRVEFKQPVFVGDVVSFYASTVREGTTSLTVSVEVEAQRAADGSSVGVTAATMTLVSVGGDSRPIPFRRPGVPTPPAAT